MTSPGGEKSPREARAAAALPAPSRGHGLPRREKPGRRARIARVSGGPFEPTPGGLVGPRGERPCRGRGNLRRAENPGALPSERRRRGFGRKKASGGWETSKTQRNRARQTRGSRFPIPDALKGQKPWRGGVRLRAGCTPGRSYSEEERKFTRGPRSRFIETAAAEVGRPRADPKGSRFEGASNPCGRYGLRGIP